MSEELVTLKLTRGELAALSYYLAFAESYHPTATDHERVVIEKVCDLDSSSLEMWRGILKTAQEAKK
jgi:hypothetical protein